MTSRVDSRVLFVCLGNICRSPTAEAVMRARLTDAGLDKTIAVDSAGTGAWHVGQPPDPRAQAAAARRGYALQGLIARQVTATDLLAFDYLIAMDLNNLADLRAMAADNRPAANTFVGLLGDFSAHYAGQPVGDPYYDRGEAGFDRALDMIETCVGGLIAHLREHG